MNIVTVIQGLAMLSWLAFFGAIVYAVVKAARDRSVKSSVPLVLIVLIAAVVLNIASAGMGQHFDSTHCRRFFRHRLFLLAGKIRSQDNALGSTAQ